ncbi:MAG: YfhO family protein [Bacteroidales bacterium]|nr:YfhO family protein [Bacteroidales bacterium]
MKKLRLFYPDLLMVVIMVAVSLVYMSPVFEGKTLPQGDVIHAQDQMAEIQKFQDETGVYPGWTNSAFAGMPTYQLKSPPSKNIFHWMFRALKLYLPGYTAAILFVAFLGFYFLLRTLKLNHWLALAGALAFGLSSHHLQLIGAGHVSKIYAAAYMAPVIAGMFMVFKRKYLGGGLLTALGLGIQISTNHVQVTYYLGLMVLIYIIVELVYAIREKYFDHFVKSGLVLFVALILALLPNMTMLLTTYEYTQETTRGNTGIATDGEEQKSGLKLDYMTDWSYGVGETLNMFIPNLYGGGGSGNLDENSETFKDMQKKGNPNALQAAQYASTYWGGQPFTAGPHYVGAVIIFLAIMGLFLIRGPKKWWLIAIIVLSIMLAWGKNFMVLTEFFANNVPLYAKFRDMTNNLLIAQFAIPLLAFLGIRAWVMDEKRNDKDKLKKLYIGTGIAGGIALLFALVPSMFMSFSGPQDAGIAQQGYSLDALLADREALARKDAFRSLIFVLLGAGILWASLKNKLKASYLYIAMVILIVADLWTIDKRYLNNDRFVSVRELDKGTEATPVDQYILDDQAISYRVLDISGPNPQQPNPFKYSRTSRFHKSLGGYHGAKLGRYQNMVDQYLNQEWYTFLRSINAESTVQSVTASMRNMRAVNMLNAKYIILSMQQQPLHNPFALGNAWFVNDLIMAESDAEEIAQLGQADLGQSALMNSSFADNVSGISKESIEPEDEISLDECQPNYLKYSAKNSKERLAIFSEIWYPHGWKAFIDGEETDILRANYLLRALVIPAGDHQVEFRFESTSLKTGQTIALISSLLIILLLIGYGFRSYRFWTQRTE